MNDTVLWQRGEGALALVAGLTLFWHLDSGLPWWGALLLFFAPDLSFAAYGLGPRVGAATYNLVHVYGLGLGLLALGPLQGAPLLAALGALWVAHSGFDRALGYGLKSARGFSVTHLGEIGKRG